jgi:hypothetical protein
MQEISLLLNRLSIAVQFSVVISLFGYFLLLWQTVKLHEVRLWMLAWLGDAVALAAVFVHVYADIPPTGHRAALVFYLAGKTTFAVLIFSGARHHVRPGAEPRVNSVFLAIFVIGWSVVLGVAAPDLWQAQLAESTLLGIIFLAGGTIVLRHPRSFVSRWLGWAMLVEGVVFIYSAVLLVPALWGNQPASTTSITHRSSTPGSSSCSVSRASRRFQTAGRSSFTMQIVSFSIHSNA